VQGQAPTLRYGTSTSAITRANLHGIGDPAQSSIQMRRAGFKETSNSPPGTDPSITPSLMIPTELDMDTLGCPLIQFAQQYFVTFDTGTTVDTLYAITGLTHEISQGKFATHIKFTSTDAHGVYRSVVDQVKIAIDRITAKKNEPTTTTKISD
jgi:hypothetical protein